MSFCKREERLVHSRNKPTPFSIQELGEVLRTRFSCIVFAYLIGSARNGIVPAGGDLDLAVFFDRNTPMSWDIISGIMKTVEEQYPGTECDPGILNTAGCVYRFEALKGVLLFVREANRDEYTEFYSMTCREYEDWLALLNSVKGERRRGEEKLRG